ncbi:MAG: helix-turn-helix domain-containing protein [Deltaproteobacteria bacterium]|nr:helix-turn-helix domain-containing protein [Deltaproteobacteria bacterium]
MRGESYTLREVSELLGVSKRTLQRRIREGAFPGRFLAPGRHGLETRIPAEDVRRALEDLSRAHEVPPAAEPELRMSTLMPARELQESRAPGMGMATALTQRDLETVRDAVLAIVREDRERLIGVLREAFEVKDREVAALRTQMAAVLAAVERVRQVVESAPVPAVSAGVAPASSDEGQVLRELEAIEAMLSRLGPTASH